MRIRRFLPIGQIIVDRWAIGPQTFDLAAKLQIGFQVPPIKVQDLGNGQFKIRDGRHRITAYKLLGRKEIEVTYGRVPSKEGEEKAQPATGTSPQADGAGV